MAGWVRRDVVVDGRTIAVRERGMEDQRTLVMLHGLGMHQRSWDRVAKRLQGFRLVTFDYAGHGRSDASVGYTVDVLLDDLTAVLAEVKTRRGYVLVGHSIGADLSLLHAPSSVACRGVVLVDGALPMTPPATDWERLAVMEERFMFKTLTFVGRRLGITPSLSVQEIRALTDDLEKRREGLETHLASLRVPAFYVIGDQADKVPDGQLIHQAKLDAIGEIASRHEVRVAYVPCGHLVPMRQPRRLAELVREFSIPVLG